MDRRCDRTERTAGFKQKMRRNLRMQVEFYDEETDVIEWSAHQHIFEEKSTATPAAPAAPAPAGPAAAGVVAPPPPAAQDAVAAAAAAAAPPIPAAALPAPPNVQE